MFINKKIKKNILNIIIISTTNYNSKILFLLQLLTIKKYVYINKNKIKNYNLLF